jgi:hypothetical protein
MHYQSIRGQTQDDFCLSGWYKSPIVRDQRVGEHGYWTLLIKPGQKEKSRDTYRTTRISGAAR